MLLELTQELIKHFEKKFTDGTITDQELSDFYSEKIFAPKGVKNAAERPSNTAYTTMEAMLDFVITIAPKMSERQLLQLIPRLFSVEEIYIKTKFMRTESLSKYFLVMTAILFPNNEEALLNSDSTEGTPLSDDLKPLYQTISDAIKNSLFDKSVDDEAKKIEYPTLYNNFMKMIWPSKARLLIHMAEDNANTLDLTIQTLTNTARDLYRSDKEFKKATKALSKPGKNLKTIFAEINDKKTIDMIVAVKHLQKAGEMTAICSSLTKINNTLNNELNKITEDEKKTSDINSHNLDRSNSSSFQSLTDTASRSNSKLAESRPESIRSASLWSCFFRPRSASLDASALISGSPATSPYLLATNSPQPQLFTSNAPAMTAQRPTAIRSSDSEPRSRSTATESLC